MNKTEEVNEWLSRQLVLRGSWITIEFYPELVQVFDKALACQSTCSIASLPTIWVKISH
ncbi:hypothetical protein HMPREF1991_02786 [Hoylesella loescheii DSM 19665 = JCM 12249 = ATCC 15930]|uniref:Uncharacterized protein n=1 Tax=Hoylesella loescheii DSM 19665 = JCM 12249 = ATCC 15930 TaxID=1122985 RepID=A0A069QMX1_HOYLO|nr:hypothetical protein HMPREF1991_02786 [Hoylesella loescheii DSM 19665 = JCM 12249 = ATCC 15930]